MTSVSCAPDSIAQVCEGAPEPMGMHVRDAGSRRDPPEPDPERILIGERMPLPGQEERSRSITAEAGHVLMDHVLA
jgi:hypothetical protein